MGEGLDRRKVLKGLAAAGAVAVVGGALLKKGLEKTDVEAPAGEVFPDGTRYSPEHVDGKLSEWYRNNSGKRLFEHLNFGETQNRHDEQVKKLERTRTRNFTREKVPELVRTLLKEERVHRFASDEELRGEPGKKFLVLVEEVNESWRCRGVGMGSSPKNNEDYLRLTPNTAHTLQNVAAAFQRKIADAGLASEWGVRFTVNSLVRTQDPTDKTLAGYSSPDSPHLVGMGFDISNIRFDLIHKSDNTFLMFDTRRGEQSPVHNSIVTTLNHLLIEVLEEMHEEEEIILTYEPKRVHYHITSRKP